MDHLELFPNQHVLPPLKKKKEKTKNTTINSQKTSNPMNVGLENFSVYVAKDLQIAIMSVFNALKENMKSMQT